MTVATTNLEETAKKKRSIDDFHLGYTQMTNEY